MSASATPIETIGDITIVLQNPSVYDDGYLVTVSRTDATTVTVTVSAVSAVIVSPSGTGSGTAAGNASSTRPLSGPFASLTLRLDKAGARWFVVSQNG